MASNRAASFVLPLFAVLWLAMIYASSFFNGVYHADGIFRQTDSGRVVVSAGPTLRRAGVRPGMTVRSPSGVAAERALSSPYGAPVVMIVSDGRTTRTVTVPAVSQRLASDPLYITFDLLTISFSLLLAGYLGFRKPGVMIAALILFLGGGDLSWPAFTVFFSGLPDALFGPLARVFQDLCDWFPVLALASFAVRLPGDRPAGEKRIAVAVVDALVAAGFVTGFILENPHRFQNALLTGASALIVIGACIAALRYAQPADRGRVGIVFAGVFFGGVGYAANMIWLQYGEPFVVFRLYTTISVILVPLSVAYGVLRHRVFDVGFVLNRTIVYAVTSAVVVLVLGALEFAAERFVNDLTHVESLVVQFAIAMIVIVSVRVVHGRIDRIVDSVLFRSRHEQESALRRFATTLQFYTEQGPLVRDTVDALVRYARVQGAAVYLPGDGTGLQQAASSFPIAASSVDHNDTAYVELRAHHEALQVHGVPTTFPGDRLYPMVLAGRIAGVVATGERESGEEMPPDINEAIERIAAALTISLAAIETDRIRSENATLHAQLATS